MGSRSTQDVARIVGISRVTLERWLSGGSLSAPKMIRFGKSEFREWTDRDVERVKEYKETNYRKGRGRKPKAKTVKGKRSAPVRQHRTRP